MFRARSQDTAGWQISQGSSGSFLTKQTQAVCTSGSCSSCMKWAWANEMSTWDQLTWRPHCMTICMLTLRGQFFSPEKWLELFCPWGNWHKAFCFLLTIAVQKGSSSPSEILSCQLVFENINISLLFGSVAFCQRAALEMPLLDDDSCSQMTLYSYLLPAQFWGEDSGDSHS